MPEAEQRAMGNAIMKLRAAGEQLGFPHSSAVKDSAGLRELRPRAGRSPWRGFYKRVGDLILIGAFGPEAKVDPSGFRAAVAASEERIASFVKEAPANG